jgi:hypothetical protein
VIFVPVVVKDKPYQLGRAKTLLGKNQLGLGFEKEEYR